MLYHLRIKRSAEKQLERIPKNHRLRIVAMFAKLQQDPFIGKRLEGEYKGYFSVRIWPYRVIYFIYQAQLLIFIVDVGHRQGVYK